MNAAVSSVSFDPAILNRLGDVGGSDRLGAREIGDRAGDLEDAHPRAGREGEALGGGLEEAASGGVEGAEARDVS